MAEMAPVFGSTVAVAVAPAPGLMGVTIAAIEYVRSALKIGYSTPEVNV
jgi:hypothetical protein